MRKSYIIQWKSRVNGRSGRGTKLFELADAERLAEELNREYHGIDHEVAEVTSPTASEAAEAQREEAAVENALSSESALAFH